ncbi:MAG TPA: glycosyltransferase family 39 protein [Thermoanaerobaculia bacterium]|nr:glycosyltransferase family 39 protein [Thermoanaerobaculia bacterium]
MTRSERLLIVLSAVAALALRALALLRYRFDSDEQQHLHVAWGWTAGKIQYRDVFDNHAPLFHMVTAPVLAMFGERSDILLWMRLPILVLFAIVLWATFDIAKRLYDASVAAWAVVLLALFPPFFLKSLEYRTDNLWTAFWMLALVALVRGWRPFVIGLLLGCALAVSLKTPLLLIALGSAFLLHKWSGGLQPAEDGRRAEARRSTTILAGIAGFVIVPAALSIFFVSVGAWDELVYCNFTFNTNLARAQDNAWALRTLALLGAAALVYLARKSDAPRLRWILGVTVGVFSIAIAGVWLLISPRDFLPMFPLLAIFAAAHLTDVRVLAVAVAAMLVALYYYADRFEKNTDWHVTMMDQALRLTRPGEPLMDLKGETIYRHRPFYYAFELITRTQMAKGLIPDTVAQDVVRSRTYVAQADGPMWPPASRAWLSAHFVNLGRLRAAGNWVKDGTFVVGVPGEYVVLDADGEARGTLDGTPYTSPRVLAAGAHRFIGEKETCVLWAPAWRRGHSPFHLRDLDF